MKGGDHLIVNRVSQRAKTRIEEHRESTISLYEVIEKITTEVVQNNKELIGDINLKKVPETALEVIILKIINKYNFRVLGKSRDDLIKEIMDFIFGYGPIQKILDLPECNGIFINAPDIVWAKIGRTMKRMDINFGTLENLTSYIYTIKAKLRGEINENTPLAKFEDHENKLRIVCCISPMAHISPTIVIRKHGEEGFNLKDLVEMGMLSKELSEDLIRYNDAGANIIVCGKGGAGKTTLIRALLEMVNEKERILAMEEQPEWFLKHSNAIQLKVKRSENGKIVNIEDIAEMGLVMTIDRYAYGELKAGESMAYFYGAFSGNVSITSLHSGSARQAIRKAMVMMKMSGTTLGENILLDMLHESTNIIIFLDSFVVTEVVEVIKDETGVRYKDLWKFHVTKREATFIEGNHERIGFVESPTMIEKLRNKNLLREEEALGEHTGNNHNIVDLHRDIPTRNKHRT